MVTGTTPAAARPARLRAGRDRRRAPTSSVAEGGRGGRGLARAPGRRGVRIVRGRCGGGTATTMKRAPPERGHSNPSSFSAQQHGRNSFPPLFFYVLCCSFSHCVFGLRVSLHPLFPAQCLYCLFASSPPLLLSSLRSSVFFPFPYLFRPPHHPPCLPPCPHPLLSFLFFRACTLSFDRI